MSCKKKRDERLSGFIAYHHPVLKAAKKKKKRKKNFFVHSARLNSGKKKEEENAWLFSWELYLVPPMVRLSTAVDDGRLH